MNNFDKTKLVTQFEDSLKLIEDAEFAKSHEMTKALNSGRRQYIRPADECTKNDGAIKFIIIINDPPFRNFHLFNSCFGVPLF